MRALVVLFSTVVGILAVACTSVESLDWTYDLGSVPAAVVRTRVARLGSCDDLQSGETVYESEVAVGREAEGPEGPRLGPGVYAFIVQAVDTECREIARGCDVRELPTSSPLHSTLSPIASAPPSLCAAAECNAGRCQPATLDAGVDAADMPPMQCPDRKVLGVGLGNVFGCAILEDRSLWCWGDGGVWLGRGPDVAEIQPPVQVGTEVGWSVVSGGNRGACGIREGLAYCWGRSEMVRGAQGGQGRPNNASTPTLVVDVPLGNVSALDVGEEAACAVAAGGLYCWGRNITNADNASCDPPVAGILATGSAANTSGAAIVSQSLLRPTVGGSSEGSHACAMEGAVTFCWGLNQSKQVGIEAESLCAVTTPSRAGRNFMQVSAGADFTCALTDGGPVLCWGANGRSQLGGSSETTATPTEVFIPNSEGFTIEGVTTGDRFACAYGSAAGTPRVVCWGENSQGQTGQPASSQTTIAADLPLPLISVVAGPGQACGVDAEGHLYCWGRNELGQLGTGRGGESTHVPQRVCFR